MLILIELMLIQSKALGGLGRGKGLETGVRGINRCSKVYQLKALEKLNK